MLRLYLPPNGFCTKSRSPERFYNMQGCMVLVGPPAFWSVSGCCIYSNATKSSNPNLTRIALSKVRVVKMLILLVGAFQLCSIPRIVTMIMTEFGGPALTNDVNFQYAITITLVIYYLKHVINPFIIFATSAEFRASCGYCLTCGRTWITTWSGSSTAYLQLPTK